MGGGIELPNKMSTGECGKLYYLAYSCVNASWHVSVANSPNSLENRLPKSRWQSKVSFLMLADSPGWTRVAPGTVLQDKPCSCVSPAGTQPLSPSYSKRQTTSRTERLASLYLSSGKH